MKHQTEAIESDFATGEAAALASPSTRKISSEANVVNAEAGDEGVEIGVTIEEEYGEIAKFDTSSSDDEEDDGITVVANVNLARRTPLKSSQPGKAFGRTPQTGVDANTTVASSTDPGTATKTTANATKPEDDATREELKKLRFHKHYTAFDVDIDALEEHPWRDKNVDILDYFNYGFNEKTWKIYCEKQLRLRAEKGFGPREIIKPTIVQNPSIMSSMATEANSQQSAAIPATTTNPPSFNIDQPSNFTANPMNAYPQAMPLPPQRMVPPPFPFGAPNFMPPPPPLPPGGGGLAFPFQPPNIPGGGMGLPMQREISKDANRFREPPKREPFERDRVREQERERERMEQEREKEKERQERRERGEDDFGRDRRSKVEESTGKSTLPKLPDQEKISGSKHAREPSPSPSIAAVREERPQDRDSERSSKKSRKSRSRSPSKRKKEEKSRHRDRSRSRERTRDESRDERRHRDRDREKERKRERERSQTTDKGALREKDRDGEREREREREKDREKEKEKERERESRHRDKDRRDRDRDRSKERDRNRDRSHDDRDRTSRR